MYCLNIQLHVVFKTFGLGFDIDLRALLLLYEYVIASVNLANRISLKLGL